MSRFSNPTVRPDWISSLSDFMECDATSVRNFMEDHQQAIVDAQRQSAYAIEEATSLPFIDYSGMDDVDGYAGNDANYSLVCDKYAVFKTRPVSLFTGFLNGYCDDYDDYKKVQFIGRKYNANGMRSLDPMTYQEYDNENPAQTLACHTDVYGKRRKQIRSWKCEEDDRVFLSHPRMRTYHVAAQEVTEMHNVNSDAFSLTEEPLHYDQKRDKDEDMFARKNLHVKYYEPGMKCSKWKAPGHVWLEVPSDDVIVEFASDRPFLLNQTFCLTRPLNRRVVETNTDTHVRQEGTFIGDESVPGSGLRVDSLYQLQTRRDCSEHYNVKANAYEPALKKLCFANVDVTKGHERINWDDEVMQMRTHDVMNGQYGTIPVNGTPVLMGECDESWQCSLIIHRQAWKQAIHRDVEDFVMFLKYAYGEEVTSRYRDFSPKWMEDSDWSINKQKFIYDMAHGAQRRRRWVVAPDALQRMADAAPDLMEQNAIQQWSLLWRNALTNPCLERSVVTAPLEDEDKFHKEECLANMDKWPCHHVAMELHTKVPLQKAEMRCCKPCAYHNHTHSSLLSRERCEENCACCAHVSVMSGVGENEASARLREAGKCDNIHHMEMKNTLVGTVNCDGCSQATGVVRLEENHEKGRSAYREAMGKLINDRHIWGNVWARYMSEQENGDREHRQVGEQLLAHNNYPAATGVADSDGLPGFMPFERNDTIQRRSAEVNTVVNKHLKSLIGGKNKEGWSNLRFRTSLANFHSLLRGAELINDRYLWKRQLRKLYVLKHDMDMKMRNDANQCVFECVKDNNMCPCLKSDVVEVISKWSVEKEKEGRRGRVFPSRSFFMCKLCARLTDCDKCYYVPSKKADSDDDDSDDDKSPYKHVVLEAPIRKYMSAVHVAEPFNMFTSMLKTNYGVANHLLGLAVVNQYLPFTGSVYRPFSDGVDEEVEYALYREHLEEFRYFEHPFGLGPEPGVALIPQPHSNLLQGMRFNFPRRDYSGRPAMINDDGSLTLKMAIDMELQPRQSERSENKYDDKLKHPYSFVSALTPAQCEVLAINDAFRCYYSNTVKAIFFNVLNQEAKILRHYKAAAMDKSVKRQLKQVERVTGSAQLTAFKEDHKTFAKTVINKQVGIASLAKLLIIPHIAEKIINTLFKSIEEEYADMDNAPYDMPNHSSCQIVPERIMNTEATIVHLSYYTKDIKYWQKCYARIYRCPPPINCCKP
eukprot:Seg3562.2 transcript_id=Seg3562.2/GoldUCD/mRNA.D3Y31 product="hypothetical protein" protein_id=Seg3562.2/GoldUCD/D3Y31